MEMNLETFVSNARKVNLSEDFEPGIIHEVSDFLNKLELDKDVVEFYPKYLFAENKHVTELFLFKKDFLLHVNFFQSADGNVINATPYKYNDIKLLSMQTITNGLGEYDLKIQFNNSNNLFKFNNYEDTNSHWADRFGQKLINIYKLIRS